MGIIDRSDHTDGNTIGPYGVEDDDDA